METPFSDAYRQTLEACGWLRELAVNAKDFDNLKEENKEAAVDCINNAMRHLEDVAFESVPVSALDDPEGLFYERVLVNPQAGAAVQTLNNYLQQVETLNTLSGLGEILTKIETYFPKYHGGRLSIEKELSDTLYEDSPY